MIDEKIAMLERWKHEGRGIEFDNTRIDAKFRRIRSGIETVLEWTKHEKMSQRKQEELKHTSH